MFKLEFAHAADIGGHEVQADYLMPARKKRLFVVADGVNGRPQAEVASRMAAHHIRRAFDPENPEQLGQALVSAHRAILTESRKTSRLRTLFGKSMCTTATALHITPNGRVHLASVGNTRAYLFSGRTLSQVTTDDVHPKNPEVITRALGCRRTDPTPHEVKPFQITNGDVMLLCTDGLHSLVKRKEIEAVLRAHDSLSEAAKKLVLLALERGGPDNIGVMLVRAKGGPEREFS